MLTLSTKEALVSLLDDSGEIDATATASDFAMVSIGDVSAPGRRVVLLIVERRSGRPVAAAKLAQDQRAQSECEREAHALRILDRRLSKTLRRSVPRVVHAGPLGSGWALLETALFGRSLADHLARDRSNGDENLSAALTWLADFQRETKPAVVTLPPLERRVREALAGWAFNPTEQLAIDALLSRIGSPASSIVQTPIAQPLNAWVAASHGAFEPRHVLLARGEVGVLHWSEFRDVEFGFRDAGRILHALGGIGAYSTARKNVVTKFLRRVGVDGSLQDIITLYLIAELRRFQNLRGEEGCPERQRWIEDKFESTRRELTRHLIGGNRDYFVRDD